MGIVLAVLWLMADGGAIPTERVEETNGLCVRFERAKMSDPRVGWFGFVPGPGTAPVVTPGGRVQVVSRYPAQGIVRCPGSLRIVDAQGEVFRFLPTVTRRVDDRVTAVYDIQPFGWQGGFFARRPRKGATEGRNRNDAFDEPLRLQSVAFGLKPDVSEGGFALESVRNVTVASARSERICRPLMGLTPEDDRFAGGPGCEVTAANGKTRIVSSGRSAVVYLSRPPGMKPFPGTEDIVLRTSRSFPGTVILNLRDPNTELPVRLKAPWTDETHFATNVMPNGVWQLLSLEFWLKADAKGAFPKMDFTLDSIEGVYRTSAAGACRLDVDTGNDLHVVRREAERPILTLRNLSSRSQSWKGVLRCRDYFGKGFDLPVDTRVLPSEAASVRLPWPLAKGLWRVSGEITAEDGSTANPETRFAVLDEHPRTPRLPRGQVFRPGINWHSGWYSPGDRRRCLAALDACGCKLVRAGGFEFSSIEARKDCPNWCLADTIMAETERHGISLDAITYCYPPRWTQDTNRIARVRHFKKNTVPARAGTFGAFAGRLAERYGTKIDYYEIGNEWDLVPESIMTRDEAVRIHREGFAAIRSACPAATVMPNGWTGPDVRPDHYSRDPEDRVGGDYQAYVMTRIRDCADIYPIHMHGDYRSYRRRVKQFLELRRQVGCEGIPWFANETACSIVNGQEDDVARYVFQKIMYSWANGSVDYIWYNLRATGWVEGDSEQGYGLMTADFYPRAGYAAFSAFTSVYLGLVFENTVVDRGPRTICRFAGERDGRRQIVFGGWEEAATNACPIRVKTDATAAWRVDLMGNRTRVPIERGEVRWLLEAVPSSLVLEGATAAEPSAEDLANLPVPSQAVLMVTQTAEDRAPDVCLNTARQRVDFHQAIPETRHRVWKGPKDSSADVWFDRVGNDIRLRVEVTDDVWAKEDAVRAEIRVPGRDTWKVDVPRVAEKDGKRLHAFLFRAGDYGLDSTILAKGIDFDVRVTDDDGEGEDGYMALSVETESPVRVQLK